VVSRRLPIAQANATCRRPEDRVIGAVPHRLAGLGGGVAVRVVTELSQHPSGRHHPQSGLALHDGGVGVSDERYGERGLPTRQLLI
jgi:hypothetical protein